MVGNSTFDPFKSAVIYVVNLPTVCRIAQDWCDYCNTTQPDYGRMLLPGKQNYTCVFNEVADLCTTSSPIYNTTLCDGIANNATKSLQIPGNLLLEGFGIEEIGREKVYSMLWQYIAVYFCLSCVFMWVLNRQWTRKEIQNLKIYLGLEKKPTLLTID